jgi:hypothetical protein
MEHKNLPTAEEFLRKNIDYVLSENDCKEDVENAMIEFAKLHVEAALKAAVKNVEIKPMEHAGFYMVDSGSILKSYPTENIK